MFKSKKAVAAVLSAMALSAAAPAQIAPAWNRSAQAVAILPDPAGGQRIHAIFSIEAQGVLTQADLSTQILFIRNSTLIGVQTIDFTASPSGGPSGCGAGQCLTIQACICCSIGGEVVCTCGGFIAQASHSAPVQPGDQITILLRPAPGALPEHDLADDSLTSTYQGQLVGWNRQITSVEVTPSPAGPGLRDVVVKGGLATSGLTAPVDLGFDVDLLVNGIVVSTHHMPADVTPVSFSATCYEFGCGALCGYYNGLPRHCNSAAYWAVPCSCVNNWITTFPGVASTSGDEIMVILRPAPGALPELPGFEEDEETPEPTGAPADLNGDGHVNGIDLALLLGQWTGAAAYAPCPPHRPGDLNLDCRVNGLDLAILLGAWTG